MSFNTKYPLAIDTPSDLIPLRDLAETTLSIALTAAATEMTVVSTASLPPAPSEVIIEGEHIRYTAKTATTLTGLTRGMFLDDGGTIAAAHPAGASVACRPSAVHLRLLRDAIIAVQTKLGPQANNVLSSTDERIKSGQVLVVAAFNATSRQRANADYVCDGVADQVEINAAIDALVYSVNTSSGGEIVIVGPEVFVSGPILLRRGVTIRGSGKASTTISSTSTTAIFAAKDAAAKNDHIMVRDFSLFSETLTPTLVDFRFIGRSALVDCQLFGTAAVGSIGVRLGGTTTAAQETANVVCWTNRIERCRVANVEKGLYFEGVSSTLVQTPNAIEVVGCELIPTNTATSTALDIEDGDGNWIHANDIGYAALAGAVRLGNNSGAALGNTIGPNRYENIATSGARRGVEVWGTSYSGDIIHESFYTDNILTPHVSIQTIGSSLTGHQHSAAPEILNRSWGTPTTPDRYYPPAFSITLDANYTINNPAGSYPHKRMLIRFVQDATGGRTVTWGSAYVTNGWAPNSAPNSVSVIEFQNDGTNWQAIRTNPPTQTPLRYAQTSVLAGDTVVNTTTETAFASAWTMPANDMIPGRAYRVTARGVFGTGSTAQNLTLRLKLGATVLASTGAVSTPVNLANQGWEVTATIVCLAGGNIEAQGFCRKQTAVATAQNIDMINTAPVSGINGATTNVLGLTAQWGAAGPLYTATQRQLIVESINPS